MYRFIFCVCLFLVVTSSSAIKSSDFPFLLPSNLQTRTSPARQKISAQRIISRIADVQKFEVIEINPNLFQEEKDTFIIRTVDDYKLEIRASSGVAAVWGFHHYLKNYLNSHIGWQNQRLNFTFPLPRANETVVANDRFRYYTNICTHSYSFVWWNQSEWFKHIAWMALNGINLVLAPLGQEAVWRRVYQRFGLTDDEISEHFAGPAFLAWNRMGNVRGWGGPLTVKRTNRSREVHADVIGTMMDLGIIPVLPAFAGHVPHAFTRVFPNSKFIQTSSWNKFSSEYCCPLFVDPTDPLFEKIGSTFLSEQISLDGDTHIYSADPFNELSTNTWSSDFVKNVAASIFSSMIKIDPNAVWVVQSWMFLHDSELWTSDKVRLFLEAVPRGRLLVLDLQSEQWPLYDQYNMYYGQPFIWCMLHNFGGTLGMFGDLRPINSDVYLTRNRINSTMLGIGLTMEGINQNYVVYELMLESAWRKDPVKDLEAWSAAYASRRYGCSDTTRGWKYLLKSVYAYPGVMRMRGKYVVTRKPSLRITPWAWYSSRHLIEAWGEFVRASYSCYGEGYFHDLVDVTRQVLQYRCEQLYVKLVQELKERDIWRARNTIEAFISAMEDMESILKTNPNFSLKSWLFSAYIADPEELEGYINEMNAKNQITLWGPNGEIEDYACKQWSGMFEFYYIPRWKLFLSAALSYLQNTSGPITDWNERDVQESISQIVTQNFMSITYDQLVDSQYSRYTLQNLYKRWSIFPKLQDLPYVDEREKLKVATLSDTEDDIPPSFVMLSSTTTQF